MAEGLNSAELFIRYDEPEDFSTGTILDLPMELHVPSQASSPSQATTPATGPPIGRPMNHDVQAQTQPIRIDAWTEYGWTSTAAVRAREEHQLPADEDPGQRTPTLAVRASAAYIPCEPNPGRQGGSNPALDYYVAPPVELLNEPSAIAFQHPSGRSNSSHHTYHNNTDAPPGTLQRYQQQFISPAVSSTVHSDLEQYFPLDNDDHRRKREALNTVMQSSWKQNNEFEPDASDLLQFMSLDPTEGRWHCTFWKDGHPCDCSCKKRDHAKGHIRSHIDLLPFVCNSRWYVEHRILRRFLDTKTRV